MITVQTRSLQVSKHTDVSHVRLRSPPERSRRRSCGSFGPPQSCTSLDPWSWYAGSTSTYQSLRSDKGYTRDKVQGVAHSIDVQAWYRCFGQCCLVMFEASALIERTMKGVAVAGCPLCSVHVYCRHHFFSTKRVVACRLFSPWPCRIHPRGRWPTSSHRGRFRCRGGMPCRHRHLR